MLHCCNSTAPTPQSLLLWCCPSIKHINHIVLLLLLTNPRIPGRLSPALLLLRLLLLIRPAWSTSSCCTLLASCCSGVTTSTMLLLLLLLLGALVRPVTTYSIQYRIKTQYEQDSST
jgi:hypothetical protein